MEEFLTGSGTIGVFAIFGLLCLREVLQYRRNGNGKDNGGTKEVFTRVENLVKDATAKSADLHQQTAAVLIEISKNIAVQTERLASLISGQGECRAEMRRTLESGRRPKAH